jgi:DNA polymerase elongation subunit (family B)
MSKISQTEFDSLANRYNEQVSINASYQREVIELRKINGSLDRENDELKQIIQDMTNQLIKDGELIASLAISETADEYNNRNRIS